MRKFRFNSISWEQIDRISPNFIYAFILTRSSFTRHLCYIYTRVKAFDLCQNFVSAQYLENKFTVFHQILYMHSYWQDLVWDCYTSFFPHLYQSYGPWSTLKKFSAQYLENKSTEFHQILYMNSYWQDLARDCYTSFFPNLYQSYGPWFCTKISFLLSFFRTNWQNFTKFFICIHTCVQARLYTELRIQKLCDSFYPAFETLSVRLSLKSGNQSHFPMSND